MVTRSNDGMSDVNVPIVINTVVGRITWELSGEHLQHWQEMSSDKQEKALLEIRNLLLRRVNDTLRGRKRDFVDARECVACTRPEEIEKVLDTVMVAA